MWGAGRGYQSACAFSLSPHRNEILIFEDETKTLFLEDLEGVFGGRTVASFIYDEESEVLPVQINWSRNGRKAAVIFNRPTNEVDSVYVFTLSDGLSVQLDLASSFCGSVILSPFGDLAIASISGATSGYELLLYDAEVPEGAPVEVNESNQPVPYSVSHASAEPVYREEVKIVPLAWF